MFLTLDLSLAVRKQFMSKVMCSNNAILYEVYRRIFMFYYIRKMLLLQAYSISFYLKCTLVEVDAASFA